MKVAEGTVGRVAVVGAGLSGLAAARRLTAGGASVRIFDKARGPGGRCSTRRAEGHAFDHGAQYFTCRDPAFEPWVAQWRASGAVERWRGRIARLEAGRSRPDSGRTERFVGVPGMSALGRALARGLDLTLGCRIERLERDGRHWRLVDADGAAHAPFEQVVVAVPAEQAVPLVEPVPDLAVALGQVEMEPCWAALVAFEDRVAADFDGAFVSDAPLSWVARNGSKPGRPAAECWVLHATPDWTRSRLELSREQAAEALREAFHRALGADLPRAVHQDAHRWRYASTGTALGRPFAFDRASGVGACGDWCEGGRVERAVLSGEALAQAMLQT
ncbi:MAG: NAD(P)-binding protein [Myxococcales bacterium]|nr:NAD(P)-binding protein [Myxococcales bacterium]